MIRIELTFRNLLLLFALAILFWVGYLVRDVLILLTIALMVMATLHPLVELTERRGLSHSWAVAVTMLGLLLVPIAIVAALTPLIIAETQGFARSLPLLQRHADAFLLHVGLASRVNRVVAQANLQDRITSYAVVSVQQTITVAAQVLTVVVIAGYLLSGGRRLQLVLHQFMPRSSERHIEPLLEGMERVVGGYIRGQALTSAVFGAFAFALCLALRVPDPLLLAIIAAVGDVIPLFGVPVAMLITVLVAFTHSLWQPLAIVTGYIIYSQFENHIFVPRIYSRTVNLSPLMVIVATIMGGALGGILGILIGIPIAGALKVVLEYIVAERMSGREEAIKEMRSEETDVIGAEATRETVGETTADEGDEVAVEGVPAPTYSPFEPLPDDVEAAPATTISGARYVTLSRVRTRRARTRRRPRGLDRSTTAQGLQGGANASKSPNVQRRAAGSTPTTAPPVIAPTPPIDTGVGHAPAESSILPLPQPLPPSA